MDGRAVGRERLRRDDPLAADAERALQLHALVADEGALDRSEDVRAAGAHRGTTDAASGPGRRVQSPCRAGEFPVAHRNADHRLSPSPADRDAGEAPMGTLV